MFSTSNVSFSGPAEPDRVSCLRLCQVTSEYHIFDFSFLFLIVFYFSDMFRAVRLSAVTFLLLSSE